MFLRYSTRVKFLSSWHFRVLVDSIFRVEVSTWWNGTLKKGAGRALKRRQFLNFDTAQYSGTDQPKLLCHWPWAVGRFSRIGGGQLFENKTQWKRIETRGVEWDVAISKRGCGEFIILPYVINSLSPESCFFGFSDKCEMCLRVVGRNNYIFNDIYKWRTTEILSRILAIFLHFREILNIRDKNENNRFLNDFYICFSYSR